MVQLPRGDFHASVYVNRGSVYVNRGSADVCKLLHILSHADVPVQGMARLTQEVHDDMRSLLFASEFAYVLPTVLPP
jgi:hypothetical protein